MTEIKHKTKRVGLSFQPFCFLMLPIPKTENKIHINDCLDLYFNFEILNNFKDENNINYKNSKKQSKMGIT